MSQTIEITDEDIDYSEKILLPKGKVFDDERRDFIRNLSTIDRDGSVNLNNSYK
ncbi:hypothetical protein HX005_19060 [Acinetobacter sp. R933-2]|uniref:hypothetical protein n=1 Tax=Acinetobacter sp. R933-2 TaxID=2746728 RepID=UPI0025788688|nr:hypothetical protein [Acinetobacter sp. R933-2]MDM1249461.1 hypothetical protein [Acinetobacter sp. R933-2]